MTKCTHEKVCNECIKAEIAKLKEKIVELEKKLPKCNYIPFGKNVMLPYYIQMWSQQPWMEQPQPGDPLYNQFRSRFDI